MKQRLKRMLPVIAITGIIVVISLVLYNKVTEREKERCWQLLSDAAQAVDKEITMKFKDEIIKLNLVANVMLQEDRLEAEQITLMHLEMFQPTTIFSRIDVLYPDNTVCMDNGTHKVVCENISFEEIAAKGEHMSARMTDVATGKECVYYIIPILKNDKPSAILIGTIDSNSLSAIFQPTVYDGQANICIIDSKDGNYIMDNWHDELGNAFNTPERERLAGYEDIDLKEDIRTHKTGAIAFKSRTNGKPLYMYYMPSSLFDWQVAVFVRENIVFENLIYLKKVLTIAGCAEAILLIIYFLWNIQVVNQLEKSKVETEYQLDNSNALIKCVTELSSDKDINISINNLLDIINQYFNSDATYIFEFDFEKNVLINTYRYIENEKVYQNNLKESLILNLVKWTENYNKSDNNYNELENEKFVLNRDGSKFIAVPLFKNNIIIGFVGIDNPKKHENTTLLCAVRFFITSSLARQKHQEYLKCMSYKDMLTSLYNRNKYIHILNSCIGEVLKNVGVMYIDLNGLKEINDTQSHEEGDNLICSCAKVIAYNFPEEAYRIGGDEFVILSMNIENKVFFNKIEELKNMMKREKISVSLGFGWQEKCSDLEKMLREAEQHMYKEKGIYYQTHERRHNG